MARPSFCSRPNHICIALFFIVTCSHVSPPFPTLALTYISTSLSLALLSSPLLPPPPLRCSTPRPSNPFPSQSVTSPLPSLALVLVSHVLFPSSLRLRSSSQRYSNHTLLAPFSASTLHKQTIALNNISIGLLNRFNNLISHLSSISNVQDQQRLSRTGPKTALNPLFKFGSLQSALLPNYLSWCCFHHVTSPCPCLRLGRQVVHLGASYDH